MDGMNTGRRTVMLEIDGALLDRVQRVSPDLAITVERLLSSHVASETLRREEQMQQAQAHAAATNAFIEQHGFWGEEFATL